MATPEPEANKLLDRLQSNTRDALHYARSRFLGTWLALSLLALVAGLSFWLGLKNASDQNDLTHDVAMTADETANKGAEQSDQILRYLKGEEGIPGVPGANGEDGTPGQPGSEGIPGDPGERGPPGEQGTQGGEGPQGPSGSGITGPTGAVGPMGEAGLPGPPGGAGPKGDTGAQGNIGDTGARGQTGTAGADGTVGPQGPAGPPQTFSVTSATAPSSTVSPKTIQVSCLGAGQVVGGGYTTEPQTALRLVASWPQGPQTWTVIVENDAFPPDVSWSVTAWAVCAA